MLLFDPSDDKTVYVYVCVVCVQSEAAKGGREYNGHQFVLVSFSTSAVCDVCSKPLLNKSALQCESTRITPGPTFTIPCLYRSVGSGITGPRT